MKSLIRLLLLACAATLAVGVLAAFGYRFYLERTAAALLADVKALEVGKSDFSDAQRIAEKYRRFRIFGNASVPASSDPSENVFPEHTCVPERCFFEFVIENRLLSTLHLARGAAFTAAFAVLQDRIEYSEVSLYGGHHGNNAGITEQINPRGHRAPPYDFPTPFGKPYLRVRITPAAPPAIREHAFAFNMSCFVGFAACDEPCDYLPLSWRDWETEVAKTDWADVLRRTYPKCYQQAWVK